MILRGDAEMLLQEHQGDTTTTSTGIGKTMLDIMNEMLGQVRRGDVAGVAVQAASEEVGVGAGAGAGAL
jgi:hypothetical protein